MSEVVGAGVRCDVCGYELRGLAASGVCPECAASIQSSVNPICSLRFADREWLARNVRAVWMLKWSARGMAATSAGMLLAPMVFGFADRPAGIIMAVLGVVLIASFAVQGAGAWMLGRVPVSGHAPTAGARGWVRWCGPGLMLIPGYWVVAWFVDRSRASEIVELIVFWSAAGVGVTYLVAMSRVLEGLERRAAGWGWESKAGYRRFRRNVFIIFGGLGVLVLWLTLRDGLAGGVLYTLLLMLALIALESEMARVAEATRIELAVAQERAREGS
ncbi:MAG: hypothetical protein HEQ23_10755 [Tepidisphaera sp.]